jgi:formylglycine-generating enzyme required for sulfatase activity
MLPIPMFFQQVAPAAAAPAGGDLPPLLLPVGIVVIVAIVLLRRRRQGGPTSGRSTGNPRLRVAGGVLIAVGLGWLILALQMDVSVSSCDTSVSGIGDFAELGRAMECISRPRVINIGLLSEKNNSLLLAGLTALAGIILLAASFNRGRTNSEAPKPIEGRGFTASANAWRETQASLQPEQYNDFLEAFRGTPEALLAAKHKRILQDWDGLNKTDGATVEAFLTNDLFPAMKQRVRQFIADEAGNNSSLGELNQRLLHQEAAADRIAREEADRAEAARLEQLRREEAEKIEQARREKQKQAKVVRRGAIGIAVAVAVIAAIGVSPSILSAIQEQQVKEKQAEEAAAAAEALAEAEAAAVVASKAEFDAAALEFGIRDGGSFSDCDYCPEMVLIPSGFFIMGSPESEPLRRDHEGPQRRVTVGLFAAGKYEVTWADWGRCVVAGSCASLKADGFGGGARPVTNVSWAEAVAYTKWLSSETGQTYRLLSESEWEYAARAGNSGRWSFGENEGSLGSYAWYSSNSGSATHAVGTKTVNAFGLHDVHGNVWEWVQDSYADNYSAGQPSNGNAFQGGSWSGRVYRGGSWYSYPQDLRSAIRNGSEPANRSDFIGFRVARTLSSTP